MWLPPTEQVIARRFSAFWVTCHNPTMRSLFATLTARMLFDTTLSMAGNGDDKAVNGIMCYIFS